jgi:hypothetical protein
MTLMNSKGKGMSSERILERRICNFIFILNIDAYLFQKLNVLVEEDEPDETAQWEG